MSPEGLLAFFLPFPSSLAPSPVRSSFVRSLDRLQNGKRETPIVGVTGGSLCHLPHSSFVRSLDRLQNGKRKTSIVGETGMAPARGRSIVLSCTQKHSPDEAEEAGIHDANYLKASCGVGTNSIGPLYLRHCFMRVTYAPASETSSRLTLGKLALTPVALNCSTVVRARCRWQSYPCAAWSCDQHTELCKRSAHSH